MEPDCKMSNLASDLKKPKKLHAIIPKGLPRPADHKYYGRLIEPDPFIQYGAANPATISESI